MAADLSKYDDGSHHHRWEGGKHPEYVFLKDDATGGNIYREMMFERCEFCHLGRRTLTVVEVSFTEAAVEFEREDVQWAEIALIHSIRLSPTGTADGTAAPSAARPSPVTLPTSLGVGITAERQEQG